MSLNKLQLPDFVIANLYKNNLIDTEEEYQISKQEVKIKEVIEKESTKNEIQYLGSHNKKITILLHDTENVYLDDSHLQFITTILKACNLTIADVAIINLHNQALNYKIFQEQLPSKYFILFNVSTNDVQLPFTIPMYQNQNYNQQQFLVTPSLVILNNETQEARIEKTKLWNALKNMFEIK